MKRTRKSFAAYSRHDFGHSPFVVFYEVTQACDLPLHVNTTISPTSRLVVDVYQRHACFQSLRDANRLAGKCGRCEFRHIYGGRRAHALAPTGDILTSEPDCDYQPGWQRRRLPSSSHLQ
ncbi:MAG: hypothetical protein NTY19_15985 [Planctomycetota bacterium]|nr:hypothetical protein [Planctomycetota bacterium]